jgi:hypothetical protein
MIDCTLQEMSKFRRNKVSEMREVSIMTACFLTPAALTFGYGAILYGCNYEYQDLKIPENVNSPEISYIRSVQRKRQKGKDIMFHTSKYFLYGGLFLLGLVGREHLYDGEQKFLGGVSGIALTIATGSIFWYGGTKWMQNLNDDKMNNLRRYMPVESPIYQDRMIALSKAQQTAQICQQQLQNSKNVFKCATVLSVACLFLGGAATDFRKKRLLKTLSEHQRN